MIELTSYEALDLARSHVNGATDDINRFMAVATAYLVTAYRAGRDLTTFQVSIINIGFILVAAQSIFGAWGEGWSFVHYVRIAYPEFAASEVSPHRLQQYGLAIIGTGGIIASLLFMWSVRHPRKE